MRTKDIKGDGGLTLILVIAAVALVLVAPKPKFLDPRSREADKSADTSAAVEKAVAVAVAVEREKGAAVAASLNQVGVANSQTADTPQKDFISRELSFVSPLLPAPDPKKLLESERRRVAILEGRLEQADKLYASATKDNADLISRAAKAEALAESAFAAKRATDKQLAESAAYQRGQQQAIAGLIVFAVVLGGALIWLRLHSAGLTRTLGAIIPTLDELGDEGIFNTLSRKMDTAEKKLIHKLRASLK